jgi:hypothetical protein
MATGVIILFVLTGVVGGFVGGMLGVGGGILFVPCLHMGFLSIGLAEDLAFQMSVATSLAIILVTALSSALGHTFHGAMDPRAVLIMAAMAVPSALVGAGIGHVIGGNSLKRLFGLTTLLVSYQFLRQIPLKHTKTNREITFRNYIMVGGISGLFSSILGVGGGILTVPLLHLGLDVPMHRAVANSSGLIVFSALAGTFGWIISGAGLEGRPALSLGYVNLVSWFLISFGAMFSAQAGAWMAAKTKPGKLRKPFGILLILVGINMLFF